MPDCEASLLVHHWTVCKTHREAAADFFFLKLGAISKVALGTIMNNAAKNILMTHFT